MPLEGRIDREHAMVDCLTLRIELDLGNAEAGVDVFEQHAVAFFALAQGLLRLLRIGGVEPLHEDAGDAAGIVLDRLIDKIDKALLGAGTGPLQLDRHGRRHEALAGAVDAVEQFVEALAFELRQAGTHAHAEHVATAHQP